MEKKNFKRRIIKRKRALPYRKWSDYETTLLVDYIKENEFEKPNGRIFYQTFVQTFHMNIQWTLVKNKIRNLKTLYEKALSWERSSAAQNIPDGETVESIINRICPFYDSLKHVFGEKVNMDKLNATSNQCNSNLEIENLNETIIKSSPPSSPQHVSEQEQTFSPIRIIQEDKSGIAVNNNHPTSSQSENIKSVGNSNPIGCTSMENHNACNCLMEVIKMISSYQKEKSELHKARLEFEYKKFDFEKEKAFREMELRQREMDKSERLQVLEIECKERIALQELDYKYKRF